MTITELESKYRSIPWLELINNVVDRPNVQVTPTEVINVKGPDYLTGLETLLQRTRKRYFIWNVCVVVLENLLFSEIKLITPFS